MRCGCSRPRGGAAYRHGPAPLRDAVSPPTGRTTPGVCRGRGSWPPAGTCRAWPGRRSGCRSGGARLAVPLDGVGDALAGRHPEGQAARALDAVVRGPEGVVAVRRGDRQHRVARAEIDLAVRRRAVLRGEFEGRRLVRRVGVAYAAQAQLHRAGRAVGQRGGSGERVTRGDGGTGARTRAGGTGRAGGTTGAGRAAGAPGRPGRTAAGAPGSRAAAGAVAARLVASAGVLADRGAGLARSGRDDVRGVLAVGPGGVLLAAPATGGDDQRDHERQQGDHGQQYDPPTPVDGGGKRPDRIAQRSHAQTVREIVALARVTRRARANFSGSSFR